MQHLLRSILFSLVTAGYFLFVSPVLARLVKNSVVDSTGFQVSKFSVMFGLLLIGIQVAEVYAFPKKLRSVVEMIKKQLRKQEKKLELLKFPKERRAAVSKSKLNKLARSSDYITKRLENIGTTGIVLWMFHMMVSMVMIFAALSLFGVDISTMADVHPWMALIPFVLVIKEVYLMFGLMGFDEDSISDKLHANSQTESWLWDLILVFYTWLAYSVTWASMALDTPLSNENLAMHLMDMGLAGFLFLLFYMPVRIPYFLEGMVYVRSSRQALSFWAPLGIVVGAVLLSLH